MGRAYPVRLVRDEDGSYVAEVPGVPGTLTVGSSRQEALVAALSGYVEARKDVPPPSRPRRGQPLVDPGRGSSAGPLALGWACLSPGQVSRREERLCPSLSPRTYREL